MKGLNIYGSNFFITAKTVLYIKYLIKNFDISKLKISIVENVGFEILYSWSYDGQNYSAPVTEDKFLIDSDDKDVYIGIYFTTKDPNDNYDIKSLYYSQNVDTTKNHVILKSISYNDNIFFDIKKSDDIRVVSINDVVNRFPRWNFYDFQENQINRWKDQCDAINEMYGHTCIYFKTEPVENGTVHTFANHVFRNVVAIKRIKINVPNNELPQNRDQYTDWDFMMTDDFIVHIIDRKFKLAFGEDKVPLAKDYLFLPITGKLYKVNAVQAKNGFMNQIAWWEVFLVKYEEDSSISMSEEIKNSLSDINEDMKEGIESFDNSETKQLIEDLDIFKEDTLMSAEKINAETINEKKEVTGWFSNLAVDSTGLVSLKETEHQREFVNERIDIVTVNPAENTFPVNMYDCSTVEGKVGMIYNLKDYVSVNKQSTFFENIDLSFNFVSLRKTNNPLFILTDNTDAPVITISKNRKNIYMLIGDNSIVIDYPIEQNEFYNLTLLLNNKQLSVKIFGVENKQKTLEFQNIYPIQINSCELKNMLLMGGQFLAGNVQLYINGKVVLKDDVNPLMIMNKF